MKAANLEKAGGGSTPGPSGSDLSTGPCDFAVRARNAPDLRSLIGLTCTVSLCAIHASEDLEPAARAEVDSFLRAAGGAAAAAACRRSCTLTAPARRRPRFRTRAGDVSHRHAATDVAGEETRIEIGETKSTFGPRRQLGRLLRSAALSVDCGFEVLSLMSTTEPPRTAEDRRESPPRHERARVPGTSVRLQSVRSSREFDLRVERSPAKRRNHETIDQAASASDFHDARFHGDTRSTRQFPHTNRWSARLASHTNVEPSLCVTEPLFHYFSKLIARSAGPYLGQVGDFQTTPPRHETCARPRRHWQRPGSG